MTWSPFIWRNLRFSNRLGIAGGVDKDGDMIRGWWAFGAGFLEIGTITPKPQAPNPGKIMDRAIRQKAVWNRMGFPSRGLDYVKEQLSQIPQPFFTPVFANIGKNRDTPLEQASQDYIACIQGLHNLVHGFMINVSSPNTKGLRDLLKPENLRSFLEPVIQESKKFERPILLKLSPDMDTHDLEQILHISSDLDIDGWILTNTSVQIREGLPFPAEGGVSGQPLCQRSKEVLKESLEILGSKRKGRLVISVGGAMTPEDVFERLEMGADLVQAYSALIYHSPRFFKKVALRASRTGFSVPHTPPE